MKLHSAARNIYVWNMNSFEKYLECCTPPAVWASASSKRWDMTPVFMLLFPIICLMLSSTLSELYQWLIAAIKAGCCCVRRKKGYTLSFSLSVLLFSLTLSFPHPPFLFLPLCNTLLCLHSTRIPMPAALLIDRSNAGPEWNMSTNIGWTTMKSGPQVESCFSSGLSQFGLKDDRLCIRNRGFRRV